MDITQDGLEQLDDVFLGNHGVDLALQPRGLIHDDVAVLAQDPRGDRGELEVVGLLIEIERRAEQRPAGVPLKLRRVCD